jgi:Sec-independent protein translocase protein TatA
MDTSIIIAEVSLALFLIGNVAGIVWAASRIKATVDTHGNAIGELKRRMDANDRAITEHHGRISRLEGRGK